MNKILRKKVLWVGLVILIASQACFSFAPGALPPIVSDIPNVSDSGLVQQRLQTPLPTGRPAPKNMVEHQQAPQPSGFQKIHFKLKEIIFKGNKVFSDQQLQAIFKPSLNKDISLADLQALVDQVTKLYRDAGYILSRAILPPQVIKSGTVTVQMIEGFINTVQVEGNFGRDKILIEKFSDKVKRSRPFQISYLERDMLLLNDLPGVTVKAVIKPSKSVPGGADLLLVGEVKKIQALLSYDNLGTRYLGPQEITGKVQFNSLLLRGDSNSLRYITVPHTTEMNFIEFIHTNPIGSNGMRLTLGGNYTSTHPLFVLGPLNVVSRSPYIFTDLAYPVIRTRTKNLYLHGTFNYQDVISTILSNPFYQDRIRSLTLGLNFDGTDTWHGNNNLAINLDHGFDIMGADVHFFQSRPLGVPNYTRAIVNLSRLQGINNRFSLLAAMYGQYSCEPLLAVSQYSYGGPDFGRGYDPSEIVGDDGLAGKLELQFNTMPEWKFLQAVQYYVFYDAGEVWNRDGIDLLPKQSGTSTGIGARFNILPQLTGNIYFAKPLTHNVGVFEAVNQPRRQVRGFFQITLSV